MTNTILATSAVPAVPQPELWGHVGSTPMSNKMTMINSSVHFRLLLVVICRAVVARTWCRWTGYSVRCRGRGHNRRPSDSVVGSMGRPRRAHGTTCRCWSYACGAATTVRKTQYARCGTASALRPSLCWSCPPVSRSHPRSLLTACVGTRAGHGQPGQPGRGEQEWMDRRSRAR